MPQLESAPLDGPHLVTGILFALAAIIILELCKARSILGKRPTFTLAYPIMSALYTRSLRRKRPSTCDRLPEALHRLLESPYITLKTPSKTRNFKRLPEPPWNTPNTGQYYSLQSSL